MSEELVTIYRASESHHAHLLRNVLADYGIVARVTGDSLLNAGGEFVQGGGFPVIVGESDVELARRIADAFDRHVLQAEPSEEFEEHVCLPWLDWPICPKCKARQTAVCRHCGERGDDFALAQWQGNCELSDAASSLAEALLVCHTCDDVFVPQFYRDCPWCGFHFGAGLEPQFPGEGFDLRIVFWVVLWAMATVGFLWLLYN